MNRPSNALLMILLFNSLICLIFGVSMLESGIKDAFTGYTRWLDGSALVIFGAIGVLYIFIVLLKASKSKVLNERKVNDQTNP